MTDFMHDWLFSRWGHLWCPPTLGLPFGTPQNDKLHHVNYVILTKYKSKWRPLNSVEKFAIEYLVQSCLFFWGFWKKFLKNSLKVITTFHCYVIEKGSGQFVHYFIYLKFIARGGDIGRAILMLSIYLLLNFRNLRRAISKLSSQ
jgi:hypothetical protein